MTNDELRALADALEPMASAPRFVGLGVPAFCEWLRAQADAQPVAWMYEHDGCVDTPLFTVNRWTKCEEPWNESPLFLHPAPAASQGEPKRNQPLLDLLAVIHCDGGDHTEAVGIERSIKDALDAVCVLKGKLAQAEPKREALSDEQIAEEATNRQMTAACEDAFYDGVRWAEHSHEIGGSDD